MTRVSVAEREEALEALRKAFPKGSTVYTILRSVSRSGLSRQISVLSIDGEGDPRWWSYSASKVLTSYRLKDDALVVGGVGMDMGFHVAYSLAHVLWGDGYALKHRWL